MRWSKEKIWSWYNARPWMRGCNYMSADCANRVDQWQSLGFEERFRTTEEELKLMQKTGYNTVRLILEYVVWKEEHDGFMERFDRYLSLCAKYGISCMIVLANDCMPPKTESWKSWCSTRSAWICIPVSRHWQTKRKHRSFICISVNETNNSAQFYSRKAMCFLSC